MGNVTIPRHAWVAVCDGGRGVILQNEGTSADLVLRMVASFENQTPPSHVLGASAPGAVSRPGRAPRAAYEATDLHARGEQEFLARFTKALDDHVSSTRQPRLVVVAPPRVLGWLRKQFTPALKRRLLAEVPKDVALYTVDEIKKILTA